MNLLRNENMLGKQIVHSLDYFLKIILQMAWLNFLWFIFTILGLVIGGIFPATTSAISVARKWVKDGKINSTYQTFKKTYQTEFRKSNLIGFSLVFIMLLLYLNYYALLEFGEQIPVFIVFAYYLLLIMFSFLFVWLFPLLCHYDAKVIQHFKNAFIIGLIKFPTTLAMLTSVFSIIYLSLMIPSLILFFTVSFIALSMAFFSNRVFEQIDKYGATNIRTTEKQDRFLKSISK